MKCAVYYILAKGIYVGMNFCMHEQSMNNIFLEKGAVMQSHPLYRTCVPGLIMQLCWVTGRWELLFYVQNTVRWLALSFMVGVLLVGMVTAELFVRQLQWHGQ